MNMKLDVYYGKLSSLHDSLSVLKYLNPFYSSQIVLWLQSVTDELNLTLLFGKGWNHIMNLN